MQTVSAAPIVAKLKELGPDDHSMAKQIYKSQIAGRLVTLYDPHSLADDGGPAAVTVRAENIEGYLAKGFLVDRPEPRPESTDRQVSRRGRG